MGNIQNLISVLIASVTLFVTDANAGISFDGYIKAQQALIEAQRKSPDHLIRLTDQKGNLAFAVLNYNKFHTVLTEIEGDAKESDKLKDLYVLTELILRSYSPTFFDTRSPRFAKKDNPYTLETEYLSNMEILLEIICKMSKNGDYKSASDTLQQTLKQFSSILSGQIHKGIFSNNGVAEAKRILAKLDKPYPNR